MNGPGPLFPIVAAALVLVFASVLGARDKSQSSVSVSISSYRPIRIEAGFAGYNVALMDAALGYDNPQLTRIAQRLAIGWLRYPAGTRSEAFDWRTGSSHQKWVNRASETFAPDVRADFHHMLQTALETLNAKGGERLQDAAAFAKAAGARGLIVCVNAFTDSPASLRQLVAYARDNRIPVLAWELANEPYFNRSLWQTSTAYLHAMQPFADAIRKEDAAAKIAVSMSDAGFPDSRWDDSLASFRPRYWNVIVYHHYPPVSGAPAEMMAVLNGVLLHRTTDYLNSEVNRRFGSMPVIITEAGPQDGPAPGMSGTMYGGIWSAEYALRMSTVPQVKHFGIHQLLGPAGIEVTNNHLNDLLTAHQNGKSFSSAAYDYGLYESAQGTAYALAARAIDSASVVYRTTVEGGGPATLAKGAAAPAVFGQSYGSRWRTVLVLTNKGSRSELVSISFDGKLLRGTFGIVSVSAPDPSARNGFKSEIVYPRRSVARDLVKLPAYSVVEVSWGRKPGAMAALAQRRANARNLNEGAEHMKPRTLRRDSCMYCLRTPAGSKLPE